MGLWAKGRACMMNTCDLSFIYFSLESFSNVLISAATRALLLVTSVFSVPVHVFWGEPQIISSPLTTSRWRHTTELCTSPRELCLSRQDKYPPPLLALICFLAP